MAAGGYQAPASPASASGPGRLSRRTDGGAAQQLRELPDAQYGEAETFRDLQRAAPLSQVPSASTPAGGPATGMTPEVVPFGAPTMDPDEPTTAGANAGAGPDLNSISTSPARRPISVALQQLAPHDVAGDIADLLAEAQRLGL